MSEEMGLAYGNVIEQAVLSGGLPVPSMSLENLQDVQLSMVWRSQDLNLSSTQIKVTYAEAPLIRVIVIANHNLTVDGKIRIRGSSDPAFPVSAVGEVGSPIGFGFLFTYAEGGVTVNDTGWVDVYPPVYQSTDLAWEADNFWSGKYLARDIAAYNTYSLVLDQNVQVSHWLIEFDDAANPDGFVQAGRIFMAPFWQPVYNASFGATLGWETGTEVQRSLSGAEYFDYRRPYRVAQFKFNTMTEDEGLGGPFEIMRQVGIDGEVFFMWNPEDTLHKPRRQFLGRLRTLSPLEFPEGFIDGNFRTSVPMEVQERVP